MESQRTPQSNLEPCSPAVSEPTADEMKAMRQAAPNTWACISAMRWLWYLPDPAEELRRLDSRLGAR